MKLYFQILEKKQKKLFYFILFLIIISSFLEVIGIGAVIPLISLILEDNSYNNNQTLQNIIIFLDISESNLILVFILGFFIIYIFKSLFLIFLNFYQIKFMFNVSTGLSKKLFTTYLKQPYLFFINENTSKLVRNITTEIGYFSGGLYSLMIVLTEFFVFLSIGALLFYFEPIGFSIVMPIIFLTAYIFHRVTKKKNMNWGKYRQKYEGLKIKTIQQTFGGIKDVKIFNVENFLIKEFENFNSFQERMNSYQSFLVSLPRIIFEFIAILSLTILIFIVVLSDQQSLTLLPIIALFAAAAFRVIPSLNRISVSFQNIRYAMPVAKNIYNEISLDFDDSPQGNIDKNFKFENYIELQDVNFYYDNKNKFNFTDLNLKIKLGESIAIVGSSGSGKTTLVDILIGLLDIKSGKILINGVNFNKVKKYWLSTIGYVPQSIFILDDTLKSNIAFGIKNDEIDINRLDKAIKDSQLTDYINNLPNGIDTIIGERGAKMSGGQKQRLGIARALYFKPKILFLDEATSALDTKTENLFLKTLKNIKEEITLVIIAHRKNTISICDTIYTVEDGKVYKE